MNRLGRRNLSPIEDGFSYGQVNLAGAQPTRWGEAMGQRRHLTRRPTLSARASAGVGSIIAAIVSLRVSPP